MTTNAGVIDVDAAAVAQAADAEAALLRAAGINSGDTVAWLGLNSRARWRCLRLAPAWGHAICR